MKEEFLRVEHEPCGESLVVPDVDGLPIIQPVCVENVTVIGCEAKITRERDRRTYEISLTNSILVAVDRESQFHSLHVQSHIVDVVNVDVGDPSLYRESFHEAAAQCQGISLA